MRTKEKLEPNRLYRPRLNGKENVKGKQLSFSAYEKSFKNIVQESREFFLDVRLLRRSVL